MRDVDHCAVSRALSLVGKGTYVLGAGNYRPIVEGKATKDTLPNSSVPIIDWPWTPREIKGRAIYDASDCWGYVAWCHKQDRHLPGYNKGGSVVDWVNCDSAIEDARGKKQLWDLVTVGGPRPGDIVVYPSIRKLGVRIRIGHVGIIVAVPADYAGDLSTLTVVQCQSSSRPAVQQTNGALWQRRKGLVLRVVA